MSFPNKQYIPIVFLNFMAYGFPIQSFLPFLLNKDSNSFNIAFRAFILLTSIAYISLSITKKKIFKISYGWLFFISFWIAYTIRLVYDLELQNLSYLDTDSFYVYSFAFGVCLIPTIAIYSIRNQINFILSIKVLFWMLLLSNLCLIYSILSVGQWSIIGVIVSRANVITEIDGVEKSIINPITIGFYGQLLAITSIHLVNFPVFIKKNMKFLLFASAIIGILNLILGASRGPFAIFILLLIFELYLVPKQKKAPITFYLKVIGFCCIFFSLTPYIDMGEDIKLFNRISETFEARQEGEKEERDYLFESAVRQFTESPIVGDAFVTRYFYLYNSYSHNIIIDVLMSLGLIGFIIFSGFIYQIIRKIRIILNKFSEYSIYVILFVAQFLMAMLSGSLFLSNEFWLMGIVLLSLPLQKSQIFNQCE